ncbi:MAG TPA: Gfo/Idh/MocA family oxidoreductase [Candidatus Eisenbacteria bacterium]|nr:Gfo/Idh/MocA family oxidoreductase [Candidatus Eisenbacteria bacterium]
MKHQKLKVAIIGCGSVAEHGHLPAAAQNSECEVTLLVDSNLRRAKQLADIYGVPTVSDDYREAPQRADGAIIALPHHLHAPLSCDLIKRGMHVLVEKPMATSYAECQAMLKAAQERGVVLAVGLIRRFLQSARFVAWALRQGLLGQIKAFDVREGNVYSWPVQSDFFFRRESAGGGVLLDTGAHTLDLLLWWLGDATSLEYYDDAYGGVEADCKLYLTMMSGARGVIELSRTRNLRNTAIITGERGAIEVHLRGNWVVLYDSDNTLGLSGRAFTDDSKEGKDQGFSDLFRPQLEDWLAAIRDRRPVAVPGTEACRSISLIEKCYLTRRHWNLPWVTPSEGQAAVLCA